MHVLKRFGLVAIIGFILSGCGGGFGEINTDYSLYDPIHVIPKLQRASAIDDKGNLWTWRLNKKWEVEGLTKVDVKDAVSGTFNDHLGAIVVLDRQGRVFFQDLYAADLVVQMEIDKPVRKVISQGAYGAFLYPDGTVSANGGQSQFGFGASDSKNYNIDYSGFSNIRDIYWGGNYLVAIDQQGDAYAACGEGLNSVIPNQTPTSDGTPVKIEGLKNIKRFYQKGWSYYAFDKEDNIYSWHMYEYRKGMKKLYYKGGNVGHQRVISRDGSNYPQTYNEADTEKLSPSNGYGLWQLDVYDRKLMWLDKEGQLWLCSYVNNVNGNNVHEEVTNKVRIGDFKVRLDYFKN